MKTLRQFATGQAAIPPATAWYLSDLGEFRGKQELYTRQSPQRLKALREHAMIESAVSSNRIEGVSIDPGRVRDILVAPKPLFRDRDEEEVRGYRDALAWIHAEANSIQGDEQTIKRLHALTRGQIWDAGQYKEKDGDIIERYPDGSERVRFRTVPAAETSARMADLVLESERGMGATSDRAGRVQSRLSVHPPVPRRQWPGFTLALVAAKLSAWFRGRPIHQPRTSG